ncbi:MAG: hypothetical protein JSU70_15395 [Phycisphaerales bacterium]|nr:MAG: hypothetical protein JSU70_15395 [Phycisphaerales bacterium]
MCRRLACLVSLVMVLGLIGADEVLGRTFDIRIATGEDDVEQHLGNGDIDLTSTDLELAYEDDGTPATDAQIIGLRFVDIPIGRGTQILSAYVEFEVDSVGKAASADPVNLVVEGELTPDAPAFLDATDNITDRPSWTSANVKWSVPAWTATNIKWQTPDISAVIQEIVKKPGCASGNALVLIFSDDADDPSTGLREAESFDGEALAAPLLHMEVFSVIAMEPDPADGATAVTMPLLQWTPGDSAVLHEVYFVTNPSMGPDV